jgi:hypothetical protein
MAYRIRDRYFAYVEPIWYLTIAFYGLLAFICLRISASELIRSGCLIALIRIASQSPHEVFSISKVKDAIFTQFWLRMGKTICGSAFL